MPELSKDHPTFSMHGVGHLAPSVNLRLAVNARCPGIALTSRFDLSTFADDESGAGSLLVVGSHERCRHIAGLATALASEWRHDNTIF